MSNRISRLADLLVLNRHLACPDDQIVILILGRTKYLFELLERNKTDIHIGHLVEMLGFALLK